MKPTTFQEQFELLDDIPCMAATFEFLYQKDWGVQTSSLRSKCSSANAILGGFMWLSTVADYWSTQSSILDEKLKQYK